ncbi:uncharacterized protein LOC127155614 [Labeo rohita]|uniref:uncharacterized protein LOC127155614 n=1 Tax=Labeo rohita TaxID=84645 RepID=UPI0021E25D63|nr:uncharacterized protein LOC127155614 [Labeo rohita]
MILNVLICMLFNKLGAQDVRTVSQVSVQERSSIIIPCWYNHAYVNNVKYLSSGDRWTFSKYVEFSDGREKHETVCVSDNKTTNILTIKMRNIQQSQSGTYWCGIDGPKRSHIGVGFKLKVTAVTAGLYVRDQMLAGFEAGSVTVSCYYHLPKKTGIQWCKLGGACVLESGGLLDGALVEIRNGNGVVSVNMSRLKKEHTGWYWCSVRDLQMPVHITVSTREETTITTFTSTHKTTSSQSTSTGTIKPTGSFTSAQTPRALLLRVAGFELHALALFFLKVHNERQDMARPLISIRSFLQFSPIEGTSGRGGHYAALKTFLAVMVIRQVREVRYSVLLVASLWRNQMWFPEFIKLLSATPCPIPLRKDLLSISGLQEVASCFHSHRRRFITSIFTSVGYCYTAGMRHKCCALECGEKYIVILRSAHSHSATMMMETLLLLFLLTHASGTQDIHTVKKILVQKQQTITIPCSYDQKYTNYPKYMSSGADWLFSHNVSHSRLSIVDNHKEHFFTATLREAEVSDTGTYWCGFSLPGYDDGTSFYLQVTEAEAGLSVSSQNVSGYEGGNVTIRCHGASHWCTIGGSCVGGDGVFPERTAVSDDGGVLNVTLWPLQKEDSGWYYCSNDVSQMPVYVTVMEAQDFTQFTTNSSQSNTSLQADSWALWLLVLAALLPISVCGAVMLIKAKNKRKQRAESFNLYEGMNKQQLPKGTGKNSEVMCDNLYEIMNGIKQNNQGNVKSNEVGCEDLYEIMTVNKGNTQQTATENKSIYASMVRKVKT